MDKNYMINLAFPDLYVNKMKIINLNLQIQT